VARDPTRGSGRHETSRVSSPRRQILCGCPRPAIPSPCRLRRRRGLCSPRTCLARNRAWRLCLHSHAEPPHHSCRICGVCRPLPLQLEPGRISVRPTREASTRRPSPSAP
jgi:hypothetical protein